MNLPSNKNSVKCSAENLPQVFIGVDPGITGAIAVYSPYSSNAQKLLVFDMPTRSGYVRRTRQRNGAKSRRKEVCVNALHDIFATFVTSHFMNVAVIEEVHSMPQDGPVQAFSFGKSYGLVYAMLIAHQIKTCTVRPAVWKSMMGLTSDKSASLAKAITFFPREAHLFGRMKDDGRAEAALLAYFGYRTYAGGFPF